VLNPGPPVAPSRLAPSSFEKRSKTGGARNRPGIAEQAGGERLYLSGHWLVGGDELPPNPLDVHEQKLLLIEVHPFRRLPVKRRI